MLIASSVIVFTGCIPIEAPENADEEVLIEEGQISLSEAYDVIRAKEFVDLTHAFEPGIPHHPLLPDEERTILFNYNDGFRLENFCHVGQWGTHMDPPGHFVEGKRMIDAISPKEMILPLVVLQIQDKVAENSDYTITMDDVRNWEMKHGLIPPNSFVAMRTDWHKRWPSMEEMRNEDEDRTAHYPGWSQEVLTYLLEERLVTAVGHEQTDTDPGIATSEDDYSLEYYVLDQDRYQIELLANLDKVPAHGAVIVVTVPKPKNGSGFPARAFAILP